MKITFLGTGNSQGIPMIGSNHPVCLSKNIKDKRMRSSILIEINYQYFLIDCGPDFRHQMLKNNFNQLDAVLITHEHYDHIGGIEDIRPLNFIEKKIKSIPIYGLNRVLKNIKKRFFYIFSNSSENNKKNILKVSFHQIENYCDYFYILDIKIYPLFVWHGCLSILGFRIKNVAYITDASIIPNNTINKLKGLDILILNILRKKSYKNPFSLLETLNIIRIIKPKKTYITHISNKLGFHEKIEKKLPKNVYLAYDGLVL
ncbi:MBL fold metallo-hydrolase [Blattabacterium cuenoti]|uniref:MBL fold metallo-hydrolase n=1 Tax=Blattabacterium cuenoti TaxID=1653831 RepID=UPI00163D01B2|nr:MBL fold metallo-hydrolase [Blattabacterium cuenoti]